MSSVGELTVSIIGDMSKLSKVFSQASSEVGKFGSSVTNLSTSMSSKLGSALKTVGVAALATGTALGAGLAYETYKSVTAFRDFEQAVANAASVTGKTGEAFNQAKANISAVAQELGQKTVFSSAEAADAMYNLASAGYDVSTMAASDLQPMLELASGTQYDLANTTAMTAGALAQFNLGFDQVGRVADVFSAATGVTAATMEKLNISMREVGPIAYTAGLSIEEVSAALGVMYNKQLTGETAGTGLKIMLASLLDPTKSAVDALNSMGLSLDQVNPLTNDFSTIVELLASHGLDATNAFQIFGREGANSILALTSGAGDVADLTKQLQNAGGTAETMANQQLDTLSGSLEALSGTIENLFINVGGALAPTIRQVAGYLDEMMPSIQGFVVGVVESFVSFAGKLGDSIPLVMAAGESIIEVFSNIFEVVAGNGKGVASSAADVINSIMQRISGIIIDIAPKIQEAIIGIINFVKSLVSGLSPTANSLKSIAVDVTNAFKALFSGATSGGAANAISKAVNIITGALASLSSIVSGVLIKIAPYVKTAFTSIVNAVKEAIPKIKAVLDNLKEKFDELKPNIKEAIGNLDDVWDTLKGWFESGKKIITSFINDLSPSWDNLKSSFDSAKKIFEMFEPAFTSFLGVFKGPDTNTVISVGSALAGVINLITGAIAKILKFAVDHPKLTKFVAAVAALAVGLASLSVIAAAISAGITALGVAIGATLGSIIASVTSFGAAVASGLALVTSPIALVIGAVALLYLAWKNNWLGIRDISSAIWNGLKTAANELVTGLKRVWDQLPAHITVLKTQFSNAWQSIINLFSSIKAGLVNAVNSVYSGLKTVYNSIVTSINTLKSQISTAWNQIVSVYSTVKSSIISAVSSLHSSISSIYNSIKAALSSLSNSWKTIWATVHSALVAAGSKINAALSSLYSYVSSKFAQIKSAAASILSSWKSHWSSFQSATSSAASKISSLLSSMHSTIKSKFDNIVSSIKTLISNWTAKFNDWISKTKALGTTLSNELMSRANKIKTLAANFGNGVVAIRNRFVEKFNEFVSKTKSMGSTLFNAIHAIAEKIKTLGGNFWNAGAAIINKFIAALKAGLDIAKTAVSNGLAKISNLLPHSPAKEGPFKVLPNWDAFFIDPLEKSLTKLKGMSVNVEGSLSSIKNPLDSGLNAGLGNISNVSSSSTTNSYGGDTLVLENVNINNGQDVQAIFKQFEAWTANKRRARGYI